MRRKGRRRRRRRGRRKEKERTVKIREPLSEGRETNMGHVYTVLFAIRLRTI